MLTGSSTKPSLNNSTALVVGNWPQGLCPCLVWGTWENKAMQLNETGWFRSVMPSPAWMTG